jgi:acyl carrier protein
VNVASELEQFIVNDITQGTGRESVAPDEDLLANGIVDSHGLMEIVGFLEDRYKLVVTDADLLPENFQSLERIEAFVTAKVS